MRFEVIRRMATVHKMQRLFGSLNWINKKALINNTNNEKLLFMIMKCYITRTLSKQVQNSTMARKFIFLLYFILGTNRYF